MTNFQIFKKHILCPVFGAPCILLLEWNNKMIYLNILCFAQNSWKRAVQQISFCQTCIQSWPISIFCLSCCAGSVTLPIWVFEKQKRCCYTIIIAVSHVHTFYGYNNNCLVDIVTLRLPVYIQLLILKMVSIILYFWMNYWFKDNVFFWHPDWYWWREGNKKCQIFCLEIICSSKLLTRLKW